MNDTMRILLVTEELSNIPPSGGIGAAFLELAQALARFGHIVDVLFVPAHHAAVEVAKSKIHEFADQGIRLLVPDFEKYVHDGADYSKKTYTVYRTIKDLKLSYDTIHFHDFKGLGFATQEAKRCGLGFENTTIVVQLHGPTAWTIDANKTLFTHPDQLKVDHMERCSIEWADQLVSPSQYLLNWVEENEFALPAAENRYVIPNVITGSVKRGRLHLKANDTHVFPGEIVMFGRHEERKGLLNFLKAIQILDRGGELDGIRVTLLGGFSQIAGRHSGVVITEMMKTSTTELRVIPNFGRSEALQYLAERNGAIVVIPSPVENLPYTVMEAIAIGKPTLSTKHGGGPEMVAADQHDTHLFEPSPEGIAETLRAHLNAPVVPTRFSRTPDELEQDWLDFHQMSGPGARCKLDKVTSDLPAPRVTLGITHFERPKKLLEAVWTAVRQDYPNLEIIVVDDGSTSDAALKALETTETILQRFGGRVIRQDNAYLGAARNTAARTGTGEFLIFLDDDDLAFGNMVSTLVRAATLTGSDVINCPNLFMPEDRRSAGVDALEAFDQKLSFFPLGGPLSLGTMQNVFGSATALIRRSTFEKIGGYTEQKGVGYEDYEFMLKVAQTGGRIEICPEPLYLYEVDRPSMISQTSPLQNYRRILSARNIMPHDRAVRDIMNLTAGTRALQELTNRRKWEVQVNKHSDLLTQIMVPNIPIDQLFELLSDYADRIDAGRIKKTWATIFDLSVQPGEDHNDQPTSLSRHRFETAQPVSEADPHATLLHLCLLDRHEDALEYLKAKLDELPYITESAVQWFSLLATHFEGGDYSHFDRLCASFLERPISASLSGVIIARAADLPALHAKSLTMTQAHLVERYKSNEERYRNQFPEVEDAISVRAILPDGMEHFKRHGYAERRPGYQDFTAAAERLSTRGIEIHPWELPQSFGYDGFQEMATRVGDRFKPNLRLETSEIPEKVA